ncbi:hypothetical protein MMC27_001505 [Xylographa pallens]|nr:hypothetical protein [Xylographa pallens]
MFSPRSPNSSDALFANANNFGYEDIVGSLSQETLEIPTITTTTTTLSASLYDGVQFGVCEDFPAFLSHWDPLPGTSDDYQDLAFPEPQSTPTPELKTFVYPSEESTSVKRSRKPNTCNKDMFRISKRHNRNSTKRTQQGTSDSDLRLKSQRRKIATQDEGRMSHAAVAGCHHWLQSHPGIIPGDVEMLGLHLAYRAPLGSVHQWFRDLGRSQKVVSRSGESQPISGSILTQPYRHNRKICSRKGQPNNGPRECANKDPSKPYVCTSRCGKTFRKKDSWRKHEEINFPPELWRCSVGPCKDKPSKARVRFRKDHFRIHLRKCHKYGEVLEQDLQSCWYAIDSLFDRRCIFQNCNEHFRDWKDRIDHVAKELDTDWIPSDWRNVDAGDQNVEHENTQSISSDGSRSETGSHDTSESTDSNNDDNDNNDNHGSGEDPGTVSSGGTGAGTELESYYGKISTNNGSGAQTRDKGNREGAFQYHGQSNDLGKKEISYAASPQVIDAPMQSNPSSTNIMVASLNYLLQRIPSAPSPLQYYVSRPEDYEKLALGMRTGGPNINEDLRFLTRRLDIGTSASRRLQPSTHATLALPLRARYNASFSSKFSS